MKGFPHYYVAAIVIGLACSPLLAAATFDFPPPKTLDPANRISLYATKYHDWPAAAYNGPNAVEVRGTNGESLGIKLKPADLCYAALEGTAVVTIGNDRKVINSAGALLPTAVTDCTGILGPKASAAARRDAKRWGRQAFQVLGADAPYGVGSRGEELVPFRTVAGDKNELTYGTVLFIPRLKGKQMSDGEGGSFVHDGYVMVADRGSLVGQHHIDFFTGVLKGNPAPDIATNDPKRPFEAYVVHDDKIIAALRQMHRRKP